MEAEKNQPLSLKENMLWNSIGSFFYLVCTWLTTVLVVRLSTSYSDSGSLAVAMAVGNITSTIVFFKTRPVQVGCKETEYSAADFVGFKVICSAAGLLVSLIYTLFTVDIANYPTTIMYILFKIIETFIDVYQGIFQRNDRLDIAGKSQMARGVLIVASFSIGLSVFHTLLNSIILMTLTTLFVVIFYDRRIANRFTQAHAVYNVCQIKRIARTCFPGFISCLLISLVVSQTRQSYALRYGNELLGVYAAVATPTVVIQAIANYLYAPLYKPISDALRVHDKDWISQLLNKIIAIILLLLIAGCLASAFLGSFALSRLYSPSISIHSNLLYGALAVATTNACLYFLVDVLILMKDTIGTIAASFTPVCCSVLATGLLLNQDSNSISIIISISYAIGIMISMVSIKTRLSQWPSK